jgi:hypothetical protein
MAFFRAEQRKLVNEMSRQSFRHDYGLYRWYWTTRGVESGITDHVNSKAGLRRTMAIFRECRMLKRKQDFRHLEHLMGDLEGHYGVPN